MMKKICIDQPLLALEKVTFRYQKEGTPILDSVDFKIQPGEKIGIIGDNGSGKSTIAKILLGLCTPESGLVDVFQRRAEWGNHYPSLGYIGDPSYSPGGMGLPTGMSVRNLVSSFKRICSGCNNESSTQLEKDLALEVFYDTDIANLSKGQRMRVMAFLALSKKPALLIADEATEGLDAHSQKIVLACIKEASICDGFGMIWISHKRYETATLADTVYELSNGKLNKSRLSGFICELENSRDSKTFVQSDMSNEESLEAISKIFIDSQVDTFKLVGERLAGR